MTSTENATTYISRRPSWATETRLEPEGVMHIWEAPTVAMGADTNLDGVDYPVKVELLRDDAILSNADGDVWIDPGRTVLFLADINITSPAEGRKLAQAITEACDRWESATDADR